MSRMTLCGLTAAALALLSVGVMLARYHTVGDEVETPTGPNTWKVTLTVHGIAEAGARVWTSSPLEFRRQHVLREDLRSAQFEPKPAEPAKETRRRTAVWILKPATKPGPFKLRCDFSCAVDVARPNGSMTKLAQAAGSPPPAGRYLDVEPKNGPERGHLVETVCQVTANHERLGEQARVLFEFVSREIANEGTDGQIGPVQCLAEAAGDAGAKSRLLVALLRLKGIPARVVTGVTLSKGPRQPVHHWAEAWLHERWLPMCPFNHHYGHLPSTYLVFTLGDMPLVRAKQVRDLDFGFLVERRREGEAVETKVSWGKKFFRAASLYMLPPAEQRLVEFLLLLPVAALIICIFRNVIGLVTFGTFAPALLGMAFRETTSLPGIFVFLLILLCGWLMRRILDRYHLLQVPRISLMLSLIVTLLVVVILVGSRYSMPATRYISLFPMVILTGLIERFWTLETEDGTMASFKTLLITLLVSAAIALVLSVRALSHQLFRYPETIGLVMAAQLLIGRYTGYRLMELFRFRDFVLPPPSSAVKLAS